MCWGGRWSGLVAPGLARLHGKWGCGAYEGKKGGGGLGRLQKISPKALQGFKIICPFPNPFTSCKPFWIQIKFCILNDFYSHIEIKKTLINSKEKLCSGKIASSNYIVSKLI
jgi:hypothetical protein